MIYRCAGDYTSPPGLNKQFPEVNSFKTGLYKTVLYSGERKGAIYIYHKYPITIKKTKQKINIEIDFLCSM